MSYADNRCPCGSRRKQPDTLLCPVCVAHVEALVPGLLAQVADTSRSYDRRRTAGITALGLARRRHYCPPAP
jgi:hypothetical protein